MQLTPQTIYENERYSKSSPSPQSEAVPSSGSGVAILASGRAQLFLMQRRIIEALAKDKGWQSGWEALRATQSLAEVDLDGKAEPGDAVDEAAPEKPTSSVEAGKAASMLLSAPLSAALSSLEEFRAVYEVWTYASKEAEPD